MVLHLPCHRHRPDRHRQRPTAGTTAHHVPRRRNGHRGPRRNCAETGLTMAESRRSCASCGAPNEEDARFCEGCGTSLARICGTCGVEASATARFCRGCGAPLDDHPTQPRMPVAGPARKTVTVMFADLAGSTSFEERVDAETAREVIGGYHDLLRVVARHHRAGVTKYIGDGFMAVWGVPEIGPEDAVHAVNSAVELQERFVDLSTRVTED